MPPLPCASHLISNCFWGDLPQLLQMTLLGGYRLLNHVPNHHIHFLEHPQKQLHHHLPMQPIPMPDHSLGDSPESFWGIHLLQMAPLGGLVLFWGSSARPKPSIIAIKGCAEAAEGLVRGG